MRLDRETVTSTLLALLVVSSVVGFIAPGALAQSDSDYSHKFTNLENTRFVGFETDDFGSGTFTVEISTDSGPGGEHVVLYRENHTTAGIPEEGDPPASMFENAGAYENITITVKNAPGEPNFITGSENPLLTWDNDGRLGSTGGDRDLTCDTMESLSTSVNPAVNIVDCAALPGTTTVNATGLDQNETKQEIYESAAASSDSADTIHAIMNNQLQDAETVALIKGKNAYIEELNSGGSETASKAAATENISEYYSTHEQNVISEWNSQVSVIEYLNSLEDQENLNEGYVDVVKVNETGKDAADTSELTIQKVNTTTVTLQNGTNVDVKQMVVHWGYYNDGGGKWINSTFLYTPSTGEKLRYEKVNGAYSTSTIDITHVEVQPPTSDYEKLEAVKFGEYSSSMSSIDTQNTNAQNQMDTVVNQTYDEYQAGEINSSDLIDPYVLQNEYSPGDDYEGWSAATLSMLGTNQPTDLDQTGYMNVTLEDGTTLRGVIHSAENPSSGQFEVNKTYNPDNINGTQWIVTETSTRELTQNFTLDRIETSSGETRGNFTIVEKNYETTGAADLSKLYDQLAQMRAEINARQDAIGGGSGTPLAGIPGWSNMDPAGKAATAAGGGIGLVALGRILFAS